MMTQTGAETHRAGVAVHPGFTCAASVDAGSLSFGT